MWPPLNPDIQERDDAIEEARIAREAEMRAEAVADLERQFLLAASIGDMKAPAFFARRCYDVNAPKVDGEYPMRATTAGEVMFDSFDYGSGPTHDDVFELLCKMAKTDSEAADLLKRAAKKWGDMAYAGDA